MRFLLPLLLLTAAAFAIDDYVLGPDSQPQDVPHGAVTQGTLKESKVYPDTVREYWVCVPKQYDAATPANLMVFCDGGGFVKTDGTGFRVPVVLDNLIARKEMPVTIAVMINPGTIPAAEAGQTARANRSYEYDSLGDAYAKFPIA